MQIGGPGGMNLTGAASTAGASALFGATAPAPSGAKAEFLKRAQMTAAEQMRAQILDAMGLTEDDLKAMDTDKRAAAEAKIRDAIRTKVEEAEKEKKGVLLDIKA